MIALRLLIHLKIAASLKLASTSSQKLARQMLNCRSEVRP